MERMPIFAISNAIYFHPNQGDFHGRDAYLRQSKQVPENVLVQAIIPDTPLDPEVSLQFMPYENTPIVMIMFS